MSRLGVVLILSFLSLSLSITTERTLEIYNTGAPNAVQIYDLETILQSPIAPQYHIDLSNSHGNFADAYQMETGCNFQLEHPIRVLGGAGAMLVLDLKKCVIEGATMGQQSIPLLEIEGDKLEFVHIIGGIYSNITFAHGTSHALIVSNATILSYSWQRAAHTPHVADISHAYVNDLIEIE